MPNNISAGTTQFYYVSTQVGWLKTAPVGGGIDLRGTFTTANTVKVWTSKNGQVRSFLPEFPAMSSLDKLVTNELYTVEAKTDFEVDSIVPNNNAGFTANLLEYLATATATVGDVLQDQLPNLPIIKRQDASTAVINASVNQPWQPSALASSLGAIRIWASMEPTSTGVAPNNTVSTVASWGSSVDGLSQSNESYRPYLTTEGLEITANPPGWLSYNGAFLADSNFTIFIMERREALNAGYLLGGSSSSSGTNLLAGYASATSFVFNRLGGNNLSYTVPSSLSGSFNVWALRYNGTHRSLWLNGLKVAEVADSTDLSAYTGSALGWAFEPSYIGKVRHYMVSANSLEDGQIPQIASFLRAYTALYPTQPPQIPTGSIALALPTPNSIYARDATGVAQLIVQGEFSVEEGSLTAIEASFADRPWETIVSRPVGNTFSAAITEEVATGSLIVRFKDASSVSATITNIAIVNADPTNVQATISSSTLTVAWTAPVGVSVSTYSVGISSDNGVTWADTNGISGAVTTYAYTNLLPDDYLVRVKSNLGTSASPWVATTTLATVVGRTDAEINAALYAAAVSIFKFDDTSWVDTKGVNTLTPSGTPALGAPVLTATGNSVAFDGTSYLSVDNASAFRMTAEHSWVFQVVNTGTNSTARLGVIISKSNASGASGSRSYTIALDSSSAGDRVVLQMSNNGTTTTASTNSPYFPAKTPLFVVVLYKAGVGGYTKVIVNGVTTEGATTGLNQSTTIPVRIGANLTATTGGTINSPQVGRTDNGAFFNSILTAEDINYLWNGGSVREIVAP